MDFSDASKNGMEYASHLAKALKASLTLLYVRMSIWPEAVQLEKEMTDSNEAIQERLSLFATEVLEEFRIHCDYFIEQTTNTFEEAVASRAEEYDMVVMGTNGVDNLYQYVFGTNTFHVIEKSKCPVLIIPIGCSYKTISKMIYAYDPDTNPIFLIDQLKKFVSSLDIGIKVLHIAEENPSLEIIQKMEILRNAVKARKLKNISWSFDFQYSTDVPWALSQYMKINGGDILSLSFHQRSLIERLFTENVIKQISMIADYPVYIFWR